MHPPTGQFSRLSLSRPGMPPITRSQSHEGVAGGGPVGSTPIEPHAPLLPHPGEERSRRRPTADEDEVRSGDEDDNDGEDDDNDDDDEEDDDDEDEDDDDDDDEDEDDDDDDDEGPVRSPLTDLLYNVDNLDDEMQELVRELFRTPAPEETPPMVIEWCGISNDPDVFAFQMQEVVPRTIRIGSPTSRIPRPSCNCTGSASTPCRHLVWLMDQIAKQTLHGHHPDVPLVLDGRTGFPREIGTDAYARIAAFHIDILANTLHCGAGPPSGRPNLHRVREAREILAGLDGVLDDDGVDAYAPAIFNQDKLALERLLWGTEQPGDDDDDDDDDNDDKGSEERMEEGGGGGTGHAEKGKEVVSDEEDRPRGRRTGDGGSGDGGGGAVRAVGSSQVVRDIVERGDLQRTVLRMLVSNDEFFAMFLKLLRPSDKARDPFRKIQQRVEAVLDALLAVHPSSQQQQQQQKQQKQVRRQSQLLMPPPTPRTRRLAPAGDVGTPVVTVSAAPAALAAPAGPSLQEDSGSAHVTVAWAAQHVQDAVRQIHLLLQRQLPRPPGPWARRSAGRALVWILHALVFFHNRDAHGGATQDDRNLYQRLVGNSDGQDPGPGFFLLDALEPLHDQAHLRAQLKRVRRRIQVNGYREPYMRKLDAILAKMNAAAANAPAVVPPPPPAAGAKRQGSNTNTPTDRKPKRMR